MLLVALLVSSRAQRAPQQCPRDQPDELQEPRREASPRRASTWRGKIQSLRDKKKVELAPSNKQGGKPSKKQGENQGGSNILSSKLSPAVDQHLASSMIRPMSCGAEHMSSFNTRWEQLQLHHPIVFERKALLMGVHHWCKVEKRAPSLLMIIIQSCLEKLQSASKWVAVSGVAQQSEQNGLCGMPSIARLSGAALVDRMSALSSDRTAPSNWHRYADLAV
ncbi:uncharacterized protein LOC119271409 [Triticum dicoccoides]|uniref:uncharacterized protein LOC119271409 n=1 Tax=Triticum dicoccoides TaxID=85692 RepID=UPI00188FC889|nr:uncharacterized protein LOC119271409 [Triticum dicoccoides]